MKRTVFDLSFRELNWHVALVGLDSQPITGSKLFYFPDFVLFSAAGRSQTVTCDIPREDTKYSDKSLDAPSATDIDIKRDGPCAIIKNEIEIKKTIARHSWICI